MLREDSLARTVAPSPPSNAPGPADLARHRLPNRPTGRLPARPPARRRLGPSLFVLSDVVALGAVAATRLATEPRSLNPGWLSLLLAVVTLALLHSGPPRDHDAAGSPLGVIADVAFAVGRAGIVTLAACALLATPHGGALVLREGLITAGCVLLGRGVLMAIRRLTMRTGLWTTRTIIVGAGVVGERLATHLRDNPSSGLHPVGYIDTDPVPDEPRAGRAIPLLGGLDDLGEAIRRTGARQLILAFSSTPDREIMRKLAECDKLGIEVVVVPRLYEAINPRSTVHLVGGLPVLAVHATNPRGWKFVVKHAFDRVFAGVAVLVMAPLLVTIALAVRLTSPGPVLFRQRRIGRDGHEFTLLKFRTMRLPPRGAEPFVPPTGLAPGGIEGADRRTRVGRLLRDLSLDELPQLINVLRGDMSLIGPRPERPEYVRRYADEISSYGNRHRVKSGITGWAQIHGLRGQTSIVDRVEYDSYYIRNWSLRLDLQIALQTIALLLRPCREQPTGPLGLTNRVVDAEQRQVHRDDDHADDPADEDDHRRLHDRREGLDRGLDLVLVELGDLGEHRVEGAGLLADADHVRDHHREGARLAKRFGDRAAALDRGDDVVHGAFDNRVAGGLAGDLDRLDDGHAG